jgi:hypothetical protein
MRQISLGGVVVLAAGVLAACVTADDVENQDASAETSGDAGVSMDSGDRPDSADTRDAANDASEVPLGCCPLGPLLSECGQCTDLGGPAPCDRWHICSLEPGVWERGIDDAGCPMWRQSWHKCVAD